MGKFLIFLVCAVFAMATEITMIQIPIASKHYDSKFHHIEGLNESNQGLFVNFKDKRVPEIEFKIGTFKNSLKKQSFFFGVEKGIDFEYLRAGATGGIATNFDKPILAGAFIESRGFGIFGVRLDYTYEIENELNIVGLSLVYRF